MDKLHAVVVNLGPHGADAFVHVLKPKQGRPQEEKADSLNSLEEIGQDTADN